MERLQKVMATSGVASRRKCEEIITQGRVNVNGETITKLGTCVDPQKDQILVDGKAISLPGQRVYIMLYKPEKVVSTANDPENRKTVLDCVAHEDRLYPVGRLDYYSEGLILLTNDGDAAYHLTHPKYEIEKEYVVTIKGTIDRHGVLKLQAGVMIDDAKTAPAKVMVLGQTEHTTTLSIIIHEGRNRQVRKMLEAVEKEVLKLTRIRMGELFLGKLQPGESRVLNFAEVAYINRLK